MSKNIKDIMAELSDWCSKHFIEPEAVTLNIKPGKDSHYFRGAVAEEFKNYQLQWHNSDLARGETSIYGIRIYTDR